MIPRMTEHNRVVYRGVPMIEGWPQRIQEAQNMLTYTLQGRSIPRIRYGNEQHDWHADKVPCHDCAILKGDFHVPGCDVEECPVCGGQLLSCECDFDEKP
jgi:hypothetical protein